jgi:hypothetical protein
MRSHSITTWMRRRGACFADYRKVLAAGLPSFWHVADTWENYEKIAAVITRRYEEWKSPPPAKRWWQFWKSKRA